MRPSTQIKYCKEHDEWYSTQCAYCLNEKILSKINLLTGAIRGEINAWQAFAKSQPDSQEKNEKGEVA
jgi:hypothetical protein